MGVRRPGTAMLRIRLARFGRRVSGGPPATARGPGRVGDAAAPRRRGAPGADGCCRRPARRVRRSTIDPGAIQVGRGLTAAAAGRRLGRALPTPCPRRQNLPFYRLFVADSRSPRDGKHLEVVGHYDPIPGKDGNKHVGLNEERIKYWLSVGAQPSSAVARLLGKAGLIPMPPPKRSANQGKSRAQLKAERAED